MSWGGCTSLLSHPPRRWPQRIMVGVSLSERCNASNIGHSSSSTIGRGSAGKSADEERSLLLLTSPLQLTQQRRYSNRGAFHTHPQRRPQLTHPTNAQPDLPHRLLGDHRRACWCFHGGGRTLSSFLITRRSKCRIDLTLQIAPSESFSICQRAASAAAEPKPEAAVDVCTCAHRSVHGRIIPRATIPGEIINHHYASSESERIIHFSRSKSQIISSKIIIDSSTTVHAYRWR